MSARACIRTITCVYPPDRLSGRWMRVYQRLKRAVERARLPVRVELRSLDGLTAEADVVVVPEEMVAARDAIERRVPSGEIVVTASERGASAVDALVQRLGAERGAEHAAAPTGGEVLPRTVFRGVARIR